MDNISIIQKYLVDKGISFNVGAYPGHDPPMMIGFEVYDIFIEVPVYDDDTIQSFVEKAEEQLMRNAKAKVDHHKMIIGYLEKKIEQGKIVF